MEAATLRIDKFGIQELTIKNLASDLSLSEAALYRHFKSKNEILLGLLTYFILEMNERLALIIEDKEKQPSELLKKVFVSQLNTFVQKPAIVSVIFSEGIFQFNKELSDKVSTMMALMQNNINALITRGQNEGVYGKLLGADTITTIIMGSMRMVVLKWKLSGNKSGGLTIGNKKRLEVARALATKPKLLLLDEAVAGLTSTEVRQMVELIKNLRGNGVTILMVEHIMEAIMPIADKIVVLDSGVKIAEDRPQAVVEDENVIRAYFGEKFSKRLKAMKDGDRA